MNHDLVAIKQRLSKRHDFHIQPFDEPDLQYLITEVEKLRDKNQGATIMEEKLRKATTSLIDVILSLIEICHCDNAQDDGVTLVITVERMKAMKRVEEMIKEAKDLLIKHDTGDGNTMCEKIYFDGRNYRWKDSNIMICPNELYNDGIDLSSIPKTTERNE